MAMISDPEPPACVLSPVTKTTLKASEQGPQEAIKLDTEVVVLVDCNPISCLFLYRRLDPIERFARIDGERGVWLFNSL